MISVSRHAGWSNERHRLLRERPWLWIILRYVSWIPTNITGNNLQRLQPLCQFMPKPYQPLVFQFYSHKFLWTGVDFLSNLTVVVPEECDLAIQILDVLLSPVPRPPRWFPVRDHSLPLFLIHHLCIPFWWWAWTMFHHFLTRKRASFFFITRYLAQWTIENRYSKQRCRVFYFKKWKVNYRRINSWENIKPVEINNWKRLKKPNSMQKN